MPAVLAGASTFWTARNRGDAHCGSFGVLAISVACPQAAAFGYLAIAIIGVLRARGDETTSTAARTALR